MDNAYSEKAWTECDGQPNKTVVLMCPYCYMPLCLPTKAISKLNCPYCNLPLHLELYGNRIKNNTRSVSALLRINFEQVQVEGWQEQEVQHDKWGRHLNAFIL